MIGQLYPGNDFERLGLPGNLKPHEQRRPDIVIDQKKLPDERTL